MYAVGSIRQLLAKDSEQMMMRMQVAQEYFLVSSPPVFVRALDFRPDGQHSWHITKISLAVQEITLMA
jgi:hypothetical protein